MPNFDMIHAKRARSWRCQELRESCNVELSESIDQAAANLVVGRSFLEQVPRDKGQKEDLKWLYLVLFLQ